MGVSITRFSHHFSSFYQLSTRFLLSQEFRPTTVRTYRTALSSFFCWLSAMGIDAPMLEHVVSWKEFVKETSSLGTAQTYLAAIKLFFKWTGQQGMYPDIAASVKGIRVGRFPKKDFLALDQVLVILKKAKEGNSASRDYAMVFLMVTCGLRVSEVAHADVGDLRYVGGEPVLYVYGKGRDGKTDSVNVPKKVAAVIYQYLGTRTDLTANSPLFASVSRNNSGGRLTSRSISRIVKNLLQRSGFDGDRMTAHSLRHTAVTMSLEAGATLQQVQQFARHSLIVTTQIYAHNLERLRNPCSNKIASLLLRYEKTHRDAKDENGKVTA